MFKVFLSFLSTLPGMDKTYQREEIGAYGFAAKAVPEYSETRQEIFKGCLHRIGTKRLPIKAQSVVPSPLLFKVERFRFMV